MSAKKHHFVPQMLLRRFADNRQRVTVHRLDRAAAHPSSIRDVGHRNRGHSVYLPDREPDHDVLERQMSGLEGEAARVIDRLATGRATSVEDADREVLPGSWRCSGPGTAAPWQRSAQRSAPAAPTDGLPTSTPTSPAG